MPLTRVSGQSFNALVDRADGRRERSFFPLCESGLLVLGFAAIADRRVQ
jgi:hypothetical protein